MGISTKRGDEGQTVTLSGQRVPKYDLVIEAAGTLDEANSFIGLARASSKEKRVRRILLQVQKHLYILGAELSAAGGTGRRLQRTISETDVNWIERLIDDLEEALALPPGFVTFGGEKCSAQMDVCRTAVRKAERMAVKMSGEKLIENPFILKYLNRLSDLLFVLACFEEKDAEDRSKISRALFLSRLSDPAMRKFVILIAAIILVLIAAVVLVLIFHRPAVDTMKHMEEMRAM